MGWCRLCRGSTYCRMRWSHIAGYRYLGASGLPFPAGCWLALRSPRTPGAMRHNAVQGSIDRVPLAIALSQIAGVHREKCLLLGLGEPRFGRAWREDAPGRRFDDAAAIRVARGRSSMSSEDFPTTACLGHCRTTRRSTPRRSSEGRSGSCSPVRYRLRWLSSRGYQGARSHLVEHEAHHVIRVMREHHHAVGDAQTLNVRNVAALQVSDPRSLGFRTAG